MLINELKRALKSKAFFITILIGLIIHSLSFFVEFKQYLFFDFNAPDLRSPLAQEQVRDMVSRAFNIYAVWFSILRLYIVAMPIISSLSFSLSYLEDKNYGIIKYIDIRTKHKRYLLTKIFVNGISGGIAISLPTIIITIFIFIFFQGSINDFYGKNVYGGVLASLVTYNFPLYVAFHIFTEFVFGFAYANIALAASSVINNKIAIVLSPFLFWIGDSMLFSSLGIQYFSTERINQFYLNPAITLQEVFLELTFITVLSGVIFILNAGKRKVYEG